MNVDLQHVLTARADSLDPPAFDPHAAVADGERLVQRRRRLLVAGSALALALVLGTAVLVTTRGASRPTPAEPPVPVPTWAIGTRPLAYGQEQTLHLGERTLDTELDFLSLDLTDEGAALTTLDGGIWFTDGDTLERIGTTLPNGFVSHDGWVASDGSGPLLAWMEFRDQRIDRPELVVYDTAGRDEVVREPVPVAAGNTTITPSGNTAVVVAISGRQVFVAERQRGGPAPGMPLSRYDLDSGSLEPVGDGELDAALRSAHRALVVGPSAEGGALLLDNTPTGLDTGVRTVGTVVVRDSVLNRLHDPQTGEAVEITVPEAYEGQHLWFTGWLDDDRFSMASEAGTGELLACRISAGRCRVVVDGFSWEGKGPALTPGAGLRGWEYARFRAEQRNAGS